MALLNADIVPPPEAEQRNRQPLLAAVLALVIGGLAVATFVLMPDRATQVVREVVQAAQSLIKKDPPAEDSAKEEDTAKPASTSRRAPRSHTATPEVPTASIVRPEQPPAAPPSVTKPRLLPNADLPPGTAKTKVREVMGDPDLVISKIDRGRVVEHYVYVRHAPDSAISVMLVDGRVSSIYAGMPSVGASRTALNSTARKRD